MKKESFIMVPRKTAIGSQSGIDQSLHKPLLKHKKIKKHNHNISILTESI